MDYVNGPELSGNLNTATHQTEHLINHITNVNST
jgi:hypothetical protein